MLAPNQGQHPLAAVATVLSSASNGNVPSTKSLQTEKTVAHAKFSEGEVFLARIDGSGKQLSTERSGKNR